jgi:hypothetical protein
MIQKIQSEDSRSQGAIKFRPRPCPALDKRIAFYTNWHQRGQANNRLNCSGGRMLPVF